MVSIIDLRNRGVKAIEKEIEENGIATLSYRGEPKYVVLEIGEYEKLRKLELMLAYQQAIEKVRKGKFEIVEDREGLEKYLKRLEEVIEEK
ncbi:MAG: hypothetical protein ABGW77_06450 [Campylobacterales bacterium]